MPISLPNLDDRTYDDLLAEARALIPTYAPEWTNHNPSDPGVTLVELFAYLTEILLYRVDRVTDSNVRAFLRLLNGPDWKAGDDLANDVRETVQELRRVERAVTAADFEGLAREAAPNGVARARCVPDRDLTLEDPVARSEVRPGHVSVVLLRGREPADEPETTLEPGAETIGKVSSHLDERRLLTTKVHVVGPRYVPIGTRFTIVSRPDWKESKVESAVEAALKRFFDPLAGGVEGTGWPFGRDVYVSELYDLLDRVDGVDYVTKSEDPASTEALDELITEDEARLERNATGDLVWLALEPDELVHASPEMHELTIERPVRLG